MSFPMDLDEYPTKKLRTELNRRSGLRREGKCDYCGRLVGTPPCKFPERHNSTHKEREPLLLRFMRFLGDNHVRPGLLGDGGMRKFIDQFKGK